MSVSVQNVNIEGRGYRGGDCKAQCLRTFDVSELLCCTAPEGVQRVPQCHCWNKWMQKSYGRRAGKEEKLNKLGVQRKMNVTCSSNIEHISFHLLS